MEDGRIPKDIMYGKLATGTRAVGRPVLRFKDVCKRDMKASEINPKNWEAYASDRPEWRRVVKTGVQRSDVVSCDELCPIYVGQSSSQETTSSWSFRISRMGINALLPC